MRRNSFSLMTLLLGMAMGMVGGMLFAPTPGVHTRKRLSYKIKNYSEKLRALIKTLASAQQGVSNQAKLASQEIIDQTIQKAQQLLEEADALAAQLE